jgi:hypothetical protein
VRFGPLASALALGFVSAAAFAAARGVEVEVADTCTRIDRAQLGRLLNIEQRRDRDSGVRETRVSVSCEGDVVTLRIEQRDESESPRVRTFAASDVSGEVGARVLSLAAIELLSSPRAEPEPEPEPAPEPERRTFTPPATPPRARPPSVRLMALGAVQSFGLERPLMGGGLAVDYLRLSKLGLRLEFDVAAAEHSYEYGTAHLQLTTLSAQAGYLALHETWTARAFLGYRFGAGRISGETVKGVLAPVGTVAGACGGPLVSVGLGLRAGSWVGELGGEAGLVSFPLEGRVEGHDAVALDGYWLGLSLNVGALL